LEWEELTKMSAKGFEKKKLCGRSRRLRREAFTLALNVLFPAAFSMMPLLSVSNSTRTSTSSSTPHRSMMVMMGAIRKPAVAAAIASVPSLNGRFFVFHALVLTASSAPRTVVSGTGVLLKSSGDAMLSSPLKARLSASPATPPRSFIVTLRGAH
jgi:hypothetical protein